MIEIKGFDQSFLYRKTLLPKQLILITLISLCAANGIGIALYGIRPVVLICSVFFLIIMCIVKRRTDGELQCETVKATTKIEFLPDMIRIVNLFDQNIPVQNFICFICTSDATEKRRHMIFRIRIYWKFFRSQTCIPLSLCFDQENTNVRFPSSEIVSDLLIF